MISNYPEFTKLEIKHQKTIASITERFEPYSDFNFTSLFCWDTNNSTQVSLLNKNLVILLPDYITGEPVYSILGSNKINDSIITLLNDFGELKLVPETILAQFIPNTSVIIEEDSDNFDYIYLLSEHAELPTNKFKEKRRKASRFQRNYKGRFYIEKTNLKDPEQANSIREVVKQWSKSKNKNEEHEFEWKAIDQLLEHSAHFNLHALIIFVDEVPVGFSIHEILNDEYAISHFHKTLPDMSNMDVFLTCEAAKDLAKTGVIFDNWEQDLGIPGLKASKLSYKPVAFLKKYKFRI